MLLQAEGHLVFWFLCPDCGEENHMGHASMLRMKQKGSIGNCRRCKSYYTIYDLYHRLGLVSKDVDELAIQFVCDDCGRSNIVPSGTEPQIFRGEEDPADSWKSEDERPVDILLLKSRKPLSESGCTHCGALHHIVVVSPFES